MQERYNISGMSCSACSAHVEKAVGKLPGVDKVSVNLLQNSMLVDYDAALLTSSEIIRAVSEAGYAATLASATAKTAPTVIENPMLAEIKGLKRRLIASVCFLLPLMYISMGHMWGWPLPQIFHGLENGMTFALTQLLLTLPVIIINHKFYINGLRGFWRKAPNMDSLIALGSGAAFIYGIISLYQISYGLGHGDMALVETQIMNLYFESAAMILTLITVGKFLEARSKGRTADAVAKLLDLAPKTAILLREDSEVEVPIADVMPGDIIIVRAGSTIPVDGLVVMGEGTVDESALSGESLPVDKNIDDKVSAGTLNTAGYMQIRTTQVGEGTTLSQIIALVEQANSSKAPIARIADKVSGVFVPVVIGIALVTTIVWLALGYSVSFALNFGIAVLVISCPCALGLATPTAIMVGTTRGAEQGILFKTGESLELAHKLDTIILDKTGTVTLGLPQVTDVLPAAGVDEREMLLRVASAEALSEHPLAVAIVQHAIAQDIELLPASGFKATVGEGIEAWVKGMLMIGNQRMMQRLKVDVSAFHEDLLQLAEQGKTPLLVAEGQTLLGVIALADVVKPTSKAAVAELQAMGLQVVMISGDNARTAKAVAAQVGIEQVIAEVLPQDKEKAVRSLQEEGKVVAMIGDGINDAPALARADVGIAIGAGTDIAIEAADIVLMKSDLNDVATTIQLSRAVMRNIRQNLFWAFCYNVLGIPLAAGIFYPLLGWTLKPMFAAAAMSLSSFCVVTNALRLKWFHPKRLVGSNDTGSADKDDEMLITAAIADKKEKKTMKKTILIKALCCANCSEKVEKALMALPGVIAKADSETKLVDVTIENPAITEAMLEKAINDAGYDVNSMQDA